MLRRWSLTGLIATCGVLIAVVKTTDGAPGTAALLLAVFLGVAFVLSPRAFPRPSAGPLGTDDRPVVYWRPGCVFCLRLRARLGADAARLNWVDIWRDPAAAATVREITGGDEIVPTVVIGGQAHVNPDPSWIRDQIVPAAPQA
ncbi:glutaredoxin family protein [Actinoplanes derwentensis]|uniref:Mycoredoxin n=1 Tax=Actinoplanes derwentensis TaxID=113562 RepID=A0A1H2D990_9ACTN|nr:glutaredoxin domain-containing protein [Actinoplanes derwentensis]GID81564.1 membrane protein [Actinoplanes derwentensis]SDT79318.1 mycoredoxin [Actinoplanes derwentensis]